MIKTHSPLTGLSLGLVSILTLEIKRAWPDTSGWLTQLVRDLVLKPSDPHFHMVQVPFVFLGPSGNPQKTPGIPRYPLSYVCPPQPSNSDRGKDWKSQDGTRSSRQPQELGLELEGRATSEHRTSPTQGAPTGDAILPSERIKSRSNLFSQVTLHHAKLYRCPRSPVSGGQAGALHEGTSGAKTLESHDFSVQRDLEQWDLSN